MSPRAVLLASRNAAKLAELQRIMALELAASMTSRGEQSDEVLEILGLDDVEPFDEPPETEATFEGNALIKARAALRATGLPSMADDSGICVDALQGMPGVLSARWAGLGRDDDANNRLLLEQLHDVPADRRGAEFRCAVAFCLPDGPEVVELGQMRGEILREPRGSGGFGYDVLFVPEGSTITTAEMSAADKDAISHRGQALRAIAPQVIAALIEGR